MTTNLISRYQDRRTRRFLENEKRTAHMFPNWRTRSRRRKLVVALGVVYLFMFAVGVLCHLEVRFAPLLWLPACAVFLPLWTTLQIVSGRQGDAPADTLDEWEIQQRNEARSIGLTVTQSLVLAAVFYTIFTAVAAQADGNNSWHYASGLFTLVALLIGMSTPAMLLAWTRPDPEVDDPSH